MPTYRLSISQLIGICPRAEERPPCAIESGHSEQSEGARDTNGMRLTAPREGAACPLKRAQGAVGPRCIEGAHSL
jgi:hypothetical protein